MAGRRAGAAADASAPRLPDAVARRLLRRAASLVVVLLLVSLATFALMDLLPGDPAVAILGTNATPENLAIVRSDLGLDRPAPARYLTWLGRAVRGDLGVSYKTNEPVAATLRQRAPVSLELVGLAQVLALGLAVPLGCWAAHRAGRRADRVISAVSFAGLAAPPFGVAVLLVGVFAVRLGWFPSIGYVGLAGDPLGNLRALVLPALALAIPLAAAYVQVLRVDLVRTLAEDHIALAEANGLSARRIMFNHALRQSSLTLLTVVGLNFSTLLGSAVVIEALFALPGVGRLLFTAIQTRDYVVVQGAVAMIAVVFVVVNFGIDVLHTALDPRVRHEGRA
jgi:peptide/nickel transport system permease protein